MTPRRGAALALWLAIWLGLATGVGAAADLQLRTRLELRLQAEHATVRVTAINCGSQPALALGAELHAFGRRLTDLPAERLVPGEERQFEFQLPLPPGGRGRHALIARVLFENAGGEHFATLASTILSLGEPLPPWEVTARSQPISLVERGNLRLQIHNRSDRDQHLTAQLWLPPQLSTPASLRSFSLPPHQSTELTFELNASLGPPGSYPLTCVLQGRSADLPQAAQAAVGVRILAPGHWLSKARPWWLLGVPLAAIWILAGRRWRRPLVASKLRRCYRRVDRVLLSGLVGFLLVYLDVRLLFWDTVPTGGDTAAWYGVARHLADVLLPAGRLTGWDLSHFGGYPNFTFYFLPPFLLAVLPAKLLGLPLTITLKVVMLGGMFALPPAVYTGLRRMGYRFPWPLVGAAVATAFMLNESYSIFGGNALSTLAGEFCYMLALALFFWFLGLLYRGLQTRSGAVACGVLLGMIGLCHLFVFIPALIVCLWACWVRGRLGYMLRVGLHAAGLMAFWLLPLVALRHPFTTPVNMVWQPFDNPLAVAAGILLLVLLAGPRTIRALAVVRQRGRGGLSAPQRQAHRRWEMWMVLVLGSVGAYFGACFLQVPDIRFLPPAAYALLMLACVETPAVFAPRARPAVRVLTAVTACYLALLVPLWGPGRAPTWHRYNQGGVERTPGYPQFAQLCRHLRSEAGPGADDALNAPRVAYEKCDLYTPFGGDRAFETLPLFSGRSTLEGIHYAGSLAAPAIAFVQTQFSRDVKTPEPRIAARIAPGALPAHFQLYNISQVVVRSREAKQALAASPAFEAEAQFGDLSLFRFRECRRRYVDLVETPPLRYRGPQWPADFYTWFKDPARAQVLLVADEFLTDPADRATLGAACDSLDQAAQIAAPADKPGDALPSARIETRLKHLQIRFSTDRVGRPHLVKVTYFPNWRVQGANGVYPVSPHFMLVIPRQSTVTLTYARSGWELGGLGISLAWLAAVSAASLMRRRGWRLPPYARLRAFRRPGRLTVIPAAVRGWPWGRWMAVATILTALILAVAGGLLRNPIPRTLAAGRQAFQAAQEHLAADRPQLGAADLRRALAALHPLLTADPPPDHRGLIEALLLAARCHRQLGEFPRAADQYRRLIEAYPYSRRVDEARRELKVLEAR